MQHLYPAITITERDVRSFLEEPASSALTKALTWVIPGIVMLAGLSFLIVNARAYFAMQSLAEANAITTPDVFLASAPTAAPTLVPKALPTPTATPEPTPQPVVVAAAQATIPANTLSYGDFTISAPIHWNVPLAGNGIYTKLETGLAHIEGTAKPGQKGTVAIFGHSSHFPWAKGSYKTVFGPILKAKVGQTIQVSNAGTVYTYRVSKTYTINPDQMAVLNSTDNSVLKLITCTPLGTSLKRFVVEAEQVSPEPAGNTAFTGSQFAGQLPGDR